MQRAPDMAWLNLVVAIESAASTYVTPRDAFEHWHNGEINKICLEHGGESLVLEMVDKLGNTIASRYQYRQFLASFFPDEPPVRSPLCPIKVWTFDALWPTLDQIYAERSALLHDASPMRFSLVGVPAHDGAFRYAERPGAQTFQNPLFKTTDAPRIQLHLHMFVYLVQAALLKWVRSLL